MKPQNCGRVSESNLEVEFIDTVAVAPAVKSQPA